MKPARQHMKRMNGLRGLGAVGCAMLVLALASCASWPRSRAAVAVFQADVTVPMGHGMMGGAWLSRSVADPLEARGVVILGKEAPIVLVAVDWCEIRNEALERWQQVLAGAAGTMPERVLVSAVHQHDAPVADLGAEALLRARGLSGTVCDAVFVEAAIQRTAAALRESLRHPKPCTHLGLGRARVERVASNRRYVTPDGVVHFDRTSSTRNPAAIAAEEGLIDPWLRTLSFWNGAQPIVALHAYAVHPMSYYGKGEVSADFPGLARRLRQAEMPGVPQIYFSGASGNMTAGKYNDGAPARRPELAERLRAAMEASWRETKRVSWQGARWRVASLRLEPRDGPGFSRADLEAKLSPATAPFQQCLAAMGLNWRTREDAGQRLSIPAVDFGTAQFLLLPGESYVEYQLEAQAARPDQFIFTAGYGEGATGYIPTERHIAEGDGNLGDWWWVAPGSEPRLRQAIREALGADLKRTPNARTIHPE